MKKGNKFQPCLVKNDSGVARMLEMHNRFGMDEVELFVEQVPIDLTHFDIAAKSCAICMAHT